MMTDRHEMRTERRDRSLSPRRLKIFMNTKMKNDGRRPGDDAELELDRPNREARERAEEDSAELDQPLTCRAFLLGCAYLEKGARISWEISGF